jgi:branched-chain amino acid transport system substrate-binding protein
MKTVTVLMIAAALLLAACATPTGRATQEEPATIGVLLALTGDGASWGSDELNSVRMAVDEANAHGGINGRQIELLVEDTQTNPRAALTGFQKLADEGVQAVIGPTWEESASAIAPVAEERHVAIVSPSVSEGVELEANFPHLFKTFYSDFASSDLMQQYMVEKGHKRVAVVYNMNIWGQFRRDVFVDHAKQFDMEILGDYGLTDEVADFRTVLLKIKEADVDAIYFAFTADETIQPFLRQARELEMGVPMYTASGTENEKIAQWYDEYPQGVHHVFLADTPEILVFKQKYAQKFGKQPLSSSAPCAYDATNLVIAAMRDGATTGDEIMRWLDDVQDFKGVQTLTFDERGWPTDAGDAYVVKTVVENKFIEAN